MWTYIALITILLILPLAVFFWGIFPILRRSESMQAQGYLFEGLVYGHTLSSMAGTVFSVSAINAVIGSYFAMQGIGPAAVFICGLTFFPLFLWLLVFRKSVHEFYTNEPSLDRARTKTALSFLVSNKHGFPALFVLILVGIAMFAFLFAEASFLLLWMNYMFGNWYLLSILVPFLIMAFALAYVIIGGFKAVLQTDVLQSFVILIFLIAAFVFVAIDMFFGQSNSTAVTLNDVLFSSADIEKWWPVFGDNCWKGKEWAFTVFSASKECTIPFENKDVNILTAAEGRLEMLGGIEFSNYLYATGVAIFTGAWFLSAPDNWFRLTRGFHVESSRGTLRGVLRSFGTVRNKKERRIKIIIVLGVMALSIAATVFLSSYAGATADKNCGPIIEELRESYEAYNLVTSGGVPWEESIQLSETQRICTHVKKPPASEAMFYSIKLLISEHGGVVLILILAFISLFAITSIDNFLITFAQYFTDYRILHFGMKYLSAPDRKFSTRKLIFIAFFAPIGLAVASQVLFSLFADRYMAGLAATLSGMTGGLAGLTLVNLLALRIILPKVAGDRGWGLVIVTVNWLVSLGAAVGVLYHLQWNIPVLGFVPIPWMNFGQILVMAVVLFWIVAGLVWCVQRSEMNLRLVWPNK